MSADTMHTHARTAVITAHRRDALIIVIVTVLVRFSFFWATRFTADDAFITFRYAENLASGLGFVYNASDKVLGTSTPLFTLLLSFLNLFHVPPPIGALLVSLAASAATAVLVYRLAAFFRFGSLSFLPVLAYILWPRSLPAETCGMETALFTFLVTAAVSCYYRRLDFYAIGSATLATLTRPEGALVLGLVYVAVVWRTRTQWRLHLVNSGMLLIPWLAFATWYFGSPVPNTIPAKLALYSRFGTMGPLGNLSYLLALDRIEGWLLLAGALVGGHWIYRTQNAGRLAGLFLATLVIFYTFGRTRLFFWYAAPMYPLFLTFATAAIVRLWSKLPTAFARARNARLVIGATAAVVLLIGLKQPLNYYREFQTTLDTVHLAIGDYLYQNVSPSEFVAAEDIGYIGYYSHRTILDRDGLVSPKVIDYNRDGAYLQLLLDTNPDWVVAGLNSPTSPFLSDTTFLSRYELRSRFVGTMAEYDVFRRRE
jgi:hypothetical protein